MHNRVFRTLAAVGLALGLSPVATSAAQDKAPPPPYQQANAYTVTIAVQWNDSVRDMLPAGLQPVEGMTGGINIYTAPDGYGLAPYTAAYTYVSVTGYDAPGGTQARYILGGFYGPDPKVAAAMRDNYGSNVQAGESSQMAAGETWQGIGGADGKTALKVTVKPKGGDCPSIQGTLNYVGQPADAKDFSLLQIPFVGDFCAGDPVSVEIDAPGDNVLGKLKVVKMLGGGQLKNGHFSFSRPLPTE